MGLAGLPAGLLTLGALLVVETPNSLVERGLLDQGKSVLKRIRGTENVEPEFLDLVEASRIAKEVKHPFRNLIKRRNRPQLIIAVALQVSNRNNAFFVVCQKLYIQLVLVCLWCSLSDFSYRSFNNLLGSMP